MGFEPRAADWATGMLLVCSAGPPTSQKLANTITFIVLEDFYPARAVRQRRHPKLQLQNVSILLFIILAKHLNFKINSLNASTNRIEYLTQFITVRLQEVILYGSTHTADH